MKILILKTDLQTRKGVKNIYPIFKRHPHILSWSVDLEDIDRVLRIEATGNLSENDIIELTEQAGVYCENLPD